MRATPNLGLDRGQEGWSVFPIGNSASPRAFSLQDRHGTSMLLQRTINQTPGSHHETSDAYACVTTQLCPRHRVIVCNDAIQWILQQRKKGGAERPWRGIGYFRTRDALLRVSATLCGRIDPAAMALLLALPDQIGGAA